MINTIFRDFSYEILPKRLETYDKYCKIIRWGRRNPTRFLETFLFLEFTDHQKWIFLNSWCKQVSVILASRNSGKALPLDTYVYRAIMFSDLSQVLEIEKVKLEDIQLGDYIIDKDGKPTKVIELHPIIFDDVYEVEFEDGSIVKCNGDHLWYVYDFSKKACYSRERQIQDTYVWPTKDMIGNLMFRPDKPRYRFATPINSPIELSEKNLELEPYILGLWLGDGFKKRREIACDKQDIEEEINILYDLNKNNWTFEAKDTDWLEDSNYDYIVIGHSEDDLTKKPRKFTELLKELNIYGNKHIPDVYMNASYEQRMELLRGLFDSDGYCSKQGEFEFGQKEEKLAYDVYYLLRSLGFKCKITKNDDIITKAGKKTYSYSVIGFASKTQSLFKLKRKHDRQHEKFAIKSKYKAIKEIRKTNIKKAMRCITVDNESGTFIIGDDMTVTHNSYLTSPIVMAYSLLFPNHNTYILAPTGNQAQETFTKLEDLAKGNIASALGVSTFFLDECVRQNSKADPFTHDKNSYTVGLYNGSSINTLNSVAKNIVGIRSSLNVYDEAGKIDRDFYSLTEPFTAQDTNFITGANINTDIYPIQPPNKRMYLSSAEGIDSQLFDMYKLCFQKMLVGDPDYFVCDIDCQLSLHPYKDGKPMKPLVSQATIDAAFKTNPYKATREYYNKFDNDAGEDVFLRRSVIRKACQTYYPVHENEDGKKKYIIAYDPATKLDNSIIMVAEIFRDEQRGLMAKFVECINLIEETASGQKMVIQKPEQLEILKNVIVKFNKGAVDYDNIINLCLDSGAGGGGMDIGQYLMKEFIGPDGMLHRGWIDLEDPYMSIRADDYPGNCDKLTMFNFKRDKVNAYERTQSAVNQGLVIFPNSINPRGELEFEIQEEDGSLSMRYEKVPKEDLHALTQFDLAKEELGVFQKITKPNKTIIFELSADAKSKNFHDDRADCVAMICNKLMLMRAEEALGVVEKESEYSEMFKKALQKHKKPNNPFDNGTRGNPFINRRGPSSGKFGM